METDKFNAEPGSDNNFHDRFLLALLHLSGILPLFFPAIIIWNRNKKKVKEINDHFRDIIAFQSTILFGCFPGLWIFYWSGRLTIILIFLLLGAFLSIINAMKVINGKPYKHFILSWFKNSNTNLNSNKLYKN